MPEDSVIINFINCDFSISWGEYEDMRHIEGIDFYNCSFKSLELFNFEPFIDIHLVNCVFNGKINFKPNFQFNDIKRFLILDIENSHFLGNAIFDISSISPVNMIIKNSVFGDTTKNIIPTSNEFVQTIDIKSKPETS